MIRGRGRLCGLVGGWSIADVVEGHLNSEVRTKVFEQRSPKALTSYTSSLRTSSKKI